MGKKRRVIKSAKIPKKPSTPAERDELLAFISQELAAPNNINVDIDFSNPESLDEEIREALSKKKIKRDRVGRPRAMVTPVLQKLKTAFTIGCTIKEACNFAGIGESTYHDFTKKYPAFTDLRIKWLDTEVVAARLNVFKSVVGKKNVEDSWKTLKAKRKTEYSDKVTVEIENAITTDELEKISKGEYKALKAGE